MNDLVALTAAAAAAARNNGRVLGPGDLCCCCCAWRSSNPGSGLAPDNAEDDGNVIWLSRSAWDARVLTKERRDSIQRETLQG